MERKFPYWLAVEEGQPVKFGDLPHLMAKALHPSEEESFAYGCARLNLEKELPDAVDAGTLIVRNASGLGVHTFPVGEALRQAVVLPCELRSFLEARGIELREHARRDYPYVDPEIKKRLSEVRKEIAVSEAGLDDVSLLEASTKDYKSPTLKTRIEPQGGDSLTPTIWTICYALEETGKKVTARPVMAELKRLAGEKIHPVIGTTAGGVKYEYEKGDERELTSTQLDKRIQGWKKRRVIGR